MHKKRPVWTSRDCDVIWKYSKTKRISWKLLFGIDSSWPCWWSHKGKIIFSDLDQFSVIESLSGLRRALVPSYGPLVAILDFFIRSFFSYWKISPTVEIRGNNPRNKLMNFPKLHFKMEHTIKCIFECTLRIFV